MVTAGHLLVGWTSGFLGALHFTALFYYPGGFFYSVALFMIFSIYSLLTFWFFAAAKLADKRSPSLFSFHYLTLIFCLILVPAHKFIVQMYLDSMHVHQIHRHFGVLFLHVLNVVWIPLIVYAVISFGILSVPGFKENILSGLSPKAEKAET